MMETIKRHVFLAGLVAAVVVISLAVLLTAYFFYMGPNQDTHRLIRSTGSRAKALEQGKLFSEDLAKELAQHVDRREKQHEDLLGYIRGLGATRKPLVEGLFPTSTDVNLRHSFKTAYDAKIATFMKTLGAGTPIVPTGKGGKGKRETDDLARAAAREVYRKFTMFAHPKESFERPTWVDQDIAPSVEVARYGQEDIWLMEDIVAIIAKMNADVMAAKKDVPDALSETDMQSSSERYRPGAASAAPADISGRAPSLSGRYSQSGFFLILPWRLTVVVESAYAGELIRRLKGKETFLSVEAWRMNPITGISFSRLRTFMADMRGDYGKRGVALLEIVGESMVFQLAGGRVTTLVTAAKTPPEEATGNKTGE
jgi:hypothetical protein